MKRIVLVLAAGLLAGSCARSRPNGSASEMVSVRGTVHTILLPHYQANLPEAPGRDVFASNCLSCHTSLYVTQQAASFDQAKWESEVEKMIKPYGAPIPADQVSIIARYIVTARKIQPGSWESLSATPPSPNSSIVAAAGSIPPGDAQRGKALYSRYCASCHGDDGKSHTASAAPLLPRPTDLTSGRFYPDAIADAIISGVRGTAMPGFPTLKASQVADLIAYTQTFAQNSAARTSTAPRSAEAAKLYIANCASCHGDRGAGDGVAAPPLARTPANFHTNQPDPNRALDVIANGVPGTAMPGWKSKFDPDQRLALADYVRGFFQAQK